MNEDQTHFRVNLAQKAIAKKDGTILDSWTIYGKLDFKDLYGHVKIVNDKQELHDIAQS